MNEGAGLVTAAQIKKIQKLSAAALDRGSEAFRQSLTPEALTFVEAEELIDDLEGEQYDAKTDAREEIEGAFMVVENAVNDEDKRELLHYKKLTSAQVKQLIEYLKANVPNWRQLENWETASFVRILFPDQVKAAGGRVALDAAKFQAELVCQVAARSAPPLAPKPAPPVAMQPPTPVQAQPVVRQPPTPVQAQPPEGYGTKWKPLPPAPAGRGCLVLLAPLLVLGVTAGVMWLS